ncbi:hypothetical protein BCR43DRAFT_226812 [Syncephalastrum racemosum]|uniref:Uncharacterized protein n=1 Tax=Syncephalastrum racemosum TaxID=13706 RepID=A0A1X2HJX4_SYNRA|nr:hypothetical protein BCR43DRAFT_226812 [Syncephalastrum racemosum]
MFQMDWANTGLVQTKGAAKPDFVVYVQPSNAHHDIMVGEVKPPNASISQAESDLVKIGKELRLMLNRLILLGTPDPVVCGILVEGFNMTTFTMDLPAPQLYRMQMLAQTPIFRRRTDFVCIPALLSRLVQIKDIAIGTARNVYETAILKSSGCHGQGIALYEVAPYLPFCER